MSMLAPPINLLAWIEANRSKLRPPVGNAQIFAERGFIVMAVAGPNARKDCHVDEGPELFYQLEGDIVLRVIEDGGAVEIEIRAGELFMLPPRVPHSPQRPVGSLGLVVERSRQPHERDAFEWYCEGCGARLHRVELVLEDITTQLAPLFDAFWADERARSCEACGARLCPPS